MSSAVVSGSPGAFVPGASGATLEGMPLIIEYRSVEAFKREVGELRWPAGCPKACFLMLFEGRCGHLA